MSYIGNPIVSTDFPVDYASGNGSTTAFTLSVAPASVNSIDVQISGVSQSPQTYSVSGTTLTFSAAPPTGTNNIVVRHKGVAGIPNTPSSASVVTTSIAANAVTPAKMANGGAEFGMRNRIINGAMVIDQRNGGASITPTADQTYSVDRWKTRLSQSSKFSIQQNQGSVTPPAGFTNYVGVTSLSAYSVLSNDYFAIQQNIEGYNTADLGWGTANAKTITLSFWVRSSLTGAFGGTIYNNAADRSYPFSYTISSANTWEQKSITIAGETTGAWLTNNSNGVQLFFSLGVGSTYNGTANTWANTFYGAPTGAVNLVGTNGATFYITGVQLEVGATATNFDYRPYGTELALCQRYYATSYPYGTAVASATNPTDGANFICINTSDSGNGGPLPVAMRTAPTVAIYSTNGGTGSPSARYGANGATVTSVGLSGGTYITLPRLTSGTAALGTQGAVFNANWTASAEL